MPPDHRKKAFHSFEVLGSVVLSAPKDLTAVRRAIHDGMAAYDDGEYTGGFEPRYGLRVPTAKQTVDFVISYESTKLVFSVGEKRIGRTFGISGTSQLLNNLLAANRVPLPRKKVK